MNNLSQKPQILLHVCCAPCSPYVVDLLSQDYTPILYFYNPNIHPHEEYALRVDEIERFARGTGNALYCGDEDTDLFFDAVRGYENEPEKGKRCEICFKLRLDKACTFAQSHNIKYVTTTLTVSPHKCAKTINRIGAETAALHNVIFLAENFKKNDGFRKTVQMAKQYSFYRQNYCGCIFSKKN
ncbi:MAG: epoxyqueuosine reductase QueH [Candidatus Auribacterota bacterium]